MDLFRSRAVAPLGAAVLASSMVLPQAGAQALPPADRVTVRTHGLSADQVDALGHALRTSRGTLPAGAVAGLWVPGRGAWVGAVGRADLRRGTRMEPGLQQPIGSVTKTMTATVVLQLVQRGRLRLSDPMSRWFPRFPLADRITVEMLLNMSSGIADYVNDDFPAMSRRQRRHPHRYWRPRALIHKAAGMPRAFPVPGESWSYSNTNTVILGEIVRRMTGRSLPRLFERRLYRPLAMPRTRLQLRGSLRPPHAQTYSQLYGQVHGGPPLLRTTGFSLSLEGAAGAAVSTLADLRRWARSYGTGRRLLSPSMQRTRTDRCLPISETEQLVTSYCLGTAVVRDAETGALLTVWHNGVVLGASSYVGYYPRTGAVLVVLANQDGAAATTGGTVPDGMAATVREVVPELVGFPESAEAA